MDDLNERSPRDKDSRGGFFMTAADEFDQNSPSPRAHMPAGLNLNNQLSSPRNR